MSRIDVRQQLWHPAATKVKWHYDIRHASANTRNAGWNAFKLCRRRSLKR